MRKKEKQGKLLVARTIGYYELCLFKGVTARKIRILYGLCKEWCWEKRTRP